MKKFDSYERHPFYIMGEIFSGTVEAHHGDFFLDGIKYGNYENQISFKDRHLIELIWSVSFMGTHLFIVGEERPDILQNVNGRIFHVKPYTDQSIINYTDKEEYMKHCFIREVTKEQAMDIMHIAYARKRTDSALWRKT
jgi:hypothetical protein